MSTPDVQLIPDKPRRFLGCGCLVWAVFAGFVFLLCALIGVVGYLEAGVLLFFGWIGFLQRTLPRITLNWDLIGMGVVCVAGILVISHYFVRWLTMSIAASRGAAGHWPWRWTWCGMASLAVLFLVGMAVGGAVHQIGWISSSPEPLMERKAPNSAMYMRMIEVGMASALDDATNQPSLRQQLWDPASSPVGSMRDRTKILQSYHIMLIAPSNHVEGCVIFPRDPAMLERSGGTILDENTHERLSAEELREKIKVLGDTLKPL
jgi:hypothetical protein